MLSDTAAPASARAVGTAHPPRDSAMLLHADFGMVDVNPIAALFQMRILRDELVVGAHTAAATPAAWRICSRLGGAALRRSTAAIAA